ncbi:hypothetical protein [Paraburkholderia humisilvae]|uniref:Uncharacterized protein n=1 Tax=Paraburkholderia humisilvae TaxID=627669 RepID=A0A6J5DLU0_9BURK|nr:hypothetical protein [Paraburkholderia humisilvae]CAB3753985.1 hypothetical protein LMG29542_02211 [Paraburkholderia humisilvae]
MQSTHSHRKSSPRIDAPIDRLKAAVVQVAFAVRWKLHEIFSFRPAYAFDQAQYTVACGHEADFIQAGINEARFAWDIRRFMQGWIEGFFKPSLHIDLSFTHARLRHPVQVKHDPHIADFDESALYVSMPLTLRDLSGRFECRIARPMQWSPEKLLCALSTPVAQAFCKHHFGADAYLGHECIGSTEVSVNV